MGWATHLVEKTGSLCLYSNGIASGYFNKPNQNVTSPCVCKYEHMVQVMLSRLTDQSRKGRKNRLCHADFMEYCKIKC